VRTTFGQEFEAPEGYLDTATIGLPTRSAAQVMHDAVNRWSAGCWRPQDFVEPIAQARAAYAELVGVAAETVAAGTSTSSLVGVIASQVPDGTRVLVARNEYTSLSYPFVAQAHRGVTVEQTDLAGLAAAAPGYDVVAVSAVQSADGTLADLAALRRVRETGSCRVIVDVTQACGWLPLELAWADAVVASGYKWLLSPRGVAWMALRPDFAAGLASPLANWSAGDDPWASNYGLPMRLARDARRFDASPPWFDHLVAAAVLPWLASLDIEEVGAHCRDLAAECCERLGMPEPGSAIVSLPLPDARQKLEAAGVKAGVRRGSVRLSFHVYNTRDDVSRVVSALKS